MLSGRMSHNRKAAGSHGPVSQVGEFQIQLRSCSQNCRKWPTEPWNLNFPQFLTI
jgi:hypothetical protein